MNVPRLSDLIQPADMSQSPWSDPVLSRLIMSAQLPSRVIDMHLLRQIQDSLEQSADIAWYSLTPSSGDDDAEQETVNIHFLFKRKSAYRNIAKDPSIILDSTPMKVTFWQSMILSACRSGKSDDTRLFIKNLSKATTLQNLETYLSQFGDIKAIHRFSRSDGQPTRFALAVFKSAAGARLCLQSNHPKINNFKLKARPISDSEKELVESLCKIQTRLDRESFKLADSLSDGELNSMLQKIDTCDKRPMMSKARIDSGSLRTNNTDQGSRSPRQRNRFGLNTFSAIKDHLRDAFAPTSLQTRNTRNFELRHRESTHSYYQVIEADQKMHRDQMRIPLIVSFYAFPNETTSTCYASLPIG